MQAHTMRNPNNSIIIITLSKRSDPSFDRLTASAPSVQYFNDHNAFSGRRAHQASTPAIYSFPRGIPETGGWSIHWFSFTVPRVAEMEQNFVC